jgi:hypothetical protein
MNFQRFSASCYSAALALAFALSTSLAFAEGDKEIVREPAQKKSVPASDSDDSSNSTWGSGGTNGDFINLRVSALGLLIAYMNVDLEFKLSDDWSVGPTVTYWKFDYSAYGYTGGTLATTYKAFGVRANWSQAGAYRSGVYISPMIQLVTANVTGVSTFNGRTVTGEASAPIVTGIIGYQWFFGSGFNINTGLGLSLGTSATKAEATDGVTTTKIESSQTGGVALDFMLGYVF